MNRLLSLAGAMLVASTAMAAPEAMYLVGSFNDWILPDSGGTDFALTDADGDGVYTGEFELTPQTLNFKLLTAASDWMDSENVWGSGVYRSYPLYSDKVWENALVSDASMNANDHVGASDVVVPNWAGGTLSVSARYAEENGAASVTLTLAGTQQPAAPLIPAKIYAIGNFNDWKLPVEGNDNGAIALPLSEGSETTYWEDMSIPAGERELLFYYVDPNDNKAYYVGADLPSFTLYKFASGIITSTLQISENREETKPLTIRDWQGTRIMATVNLDEYMKNISLGALDGPTFKAPESGALYAIVKCDDHDPVIVPFKDGENLDSTVWSFWLNPQMMPDADYIFKDEYGNINFIETKKISVLLTSENSLTPTAENCWGLYGDMPAESELHTSGGCALQRCSDTPMVFTYPGEGYYDWFTIYGNLQTSISYVSAGAFEIPKPLTEIYLIGTPQGWDISGDSMPLKAVEGKPDVFEGTFELTSEDIFRFYTALGDWESNSIGSQTADTPVNVTMEDGKSYSGQCVWGKGSWTLANWKGGEVTLTVNTRDMTVTFIDAELASVGEIGVQDSNPVYFNLQGQRVERPGKGIYIRVAEGKSEKIVL